MIESPQQFLDKYRGQSLLYNKADPSLRGQCVQSVAYFINDNEYPVIWADAAEWWNKRNARYDYIANTTNAVPQPGDIIIWDATLPGSDGYGHIAVCLHPYPGTGTFMSVDQNWGGKTVHTVIHNYQHVIGWMRFKGVSGGKGGGVVAAPASQLKPQGEVIEMITNEHEAHQAYQLLRPNGDANADEIAQTAGKRTWEQFVNDAQPEVQKRNDNLKSQAQHLQDMQAKINQTNSVVTGLRETISSSQLSNQDKQAALDNALTQIAIDNAQMTTLHDQVADLQKQLSDPIGAAAAAVDSTVKLAKQKAGKSGGFITAFFRFLLQLKFPKVKKG